MFKLMCQKPAHFFICPNGCAEQLWRNVYTTWDVLLCIAEFLDDISSSRTSFTHNGFKYFLKWNFIATICFLKSLTSEVKKSVRGQKHECTIWHLSGEFSVRQAQREVVKIQNLDFSLWTYFESINKSLFWVFSIFFFNFLFWMVITFLNI